MKYRKMTQVDVPHMQRFMTGMYITSLIVNMLCMAFGFTLLNEDNVSDSLYRTYVIEVVSLCTGGCILNIAFFFFAIRTRSVVTPTATTAAGVDTEAWHPPNPGRRIDDYFVAQRSKP